jgi:hypothetical protein
MTLLILNRNDGFQACLVHPTKYDPSLWQRILNFEGEMKQRRMTSVIFWQHFQISITSCAI